MSLTCAVPGAFGQSSDAPTTPVNVTGVVINASTRAPVARALVQLGGRAMLTDHDGRFEFDQFARKRTMLDVTKPGFYFSLEPMNYGPRTLTSSELSAPLTLRLYPEALLTGTITAPDGSPLRGVPIGVMRSVSDENGHRWMPLPLGQTRTTNIRGEFRLTVPPGEYRLRTFNSTQQDSGNIVMPLLFPGDSSGNGLDVIRLHSGEEQHFDLHPLVGRAYAVLVSSESAEPGMPVLHVHAANGSVIPVGAQSIASNLYRVELPNGSYTLIATKGSPGGQQIAETNVTVAGHDVSGVVLRFQPMPAVPVEIHLDPGMSDNGSEPAPPNPYALGLMLQRPSQEMELGTYPISPEMKNGEMAFRVAPGRYRLVARTALSDWYVESATYGGSDLLRQDLVIGPENSGMPIEITVSNQTGTLSGDVCSSGSMRDCHVYLIPVTPNASPMISAGVNYIGGDSSDRVVYSVHLAPGTYRAIAFERRYSFDPRDPDALRPYASHERTITIHAGDKSTLNLNAVTEAEIAP